MTGLRAFGGVTRCAGPAFTLRLVPSRPDAPGARKGVFEEMLESVPAGNVIVIDAMGHSAAATVGDLMATRLAARDIAGLVTDGSVRDSVGLARVPISILASEVTANLRSSSYDVAAVGQSVVCAGVTVIPGDLIVVDDDGAIAVPAPTGRRHRRGGNRSGAPRGVHPMRLREGESLDGLYPPTDAIRAELRIVAKRVTKDRAWRHMAGGGTVDDGGTVLDILGPARA